MIAKRGVRRKPIPATGKRRLFRGKGKEFFWPGGDSKLTQEAPSGLVYDNKIKDFESLYVVNLFAALFIHVFLLVCGICLENKIFHFDAFSLASSEVELIVIGPFGVEPFVIIVYYYFCHYEHHHYYYNNNNK